MAKNDWILDFQVSMEMFHRYASVGGEGAQNMEGGGGGV